MIAHAMGLFTQLSHPHQRLPEPVPIACSCNTSHFCLLPFPHLAQSFLIDLLVRLVLQDVLRVALKVLEAVLGLFHALPLLIRIRRRWLLLLCFGLLVWFGGLAAFVWGGHCC